jgi:hypothetical protein
MPLHLKIYLFLNGEFVEVDLSKKAGFYCKKTQNVGNKRDYCASKRKDDYSFHGLSRIE